MNEDSGRGLSITGLGVWMAGARDVEQFRGGVADPEGEEIVPDGTAIEPRSRRRATLLTRAMADAFAQATSQAALDPSHVPTVFASALGEAPTMISLVDQMCRGEEMSPMRFATSVHSAAAAVVSISAKNKGFTTAISSDYDTVGAALQEAWCLIQCSGEPVVVVIGDDCSPGEFLSETEGFERMAVAFAFAGTEEERSGYIARIGMPELREPTLPQASLPPAIARNPSAGAADLLSAVVGGRPGVVRLDRGRGSGLAASVAFE